MGRRGDGVREWGKGCASSTAARACSRARASAATLVRRIALKRPRDGIIQATAAVVGGCVKKFAAVVEVVDVETRVVAGAALMKRKRVIRAVRVWTLKNECSYW